MTDLFDNPMGLCGFEFVEFASPTANLLEPVFEMMGFTRVAEHRSARRLHDQRRGPLGLLERVRIRNIFYPEVAADLRRSAFGKANETSPANA